MKRNDFNLLIICKGLSNQNSLLFAREYILHGSKISSLYRQFLSHTKARFNTDDLKTHSVPANLITYWDSISANQHYSNPIQIILNPCNSIQAHTTPGYTRHDAVNPALNTTQTISVDQWNQTPQ